MKIQLYTLFLEIRSFSSSLSNFNSNFYIEDRKYKARFDSTAFTIALTRTGWCTATNFSFRDRNLIEPLRRLGSVNGREEPLSFRRRFGEAEGVGLVILEKLIKSTGG